MCYLADSMDHHRHLPRRSAHGNFVETRRRVELQLKTIDGLPNG